MYFNFLMLDLSRTSRILCRIRHFRFNIIMFFCIISWRKHIQAKSQRHSCILLPVPELQLQDRPGGNFTPPPPVTLHGLKRLTKRSASMVQWNVKIKPVQKSRIELLMQSQRANMSQNTACVEFSSFPWDDQFRVREERAKLCGRC